LHAAGRVKANHEEWEEMAKTILIVDDDSDYRFQQKVQLQAAGYNVIEAENEDHAMDILETTKPDLAIFDLMMGDLDAGFSLCYHAKKTYPGLPVILVTGVTRETGFEFDASTDEERSWVKADAMLAKPVRFDQLERELERLLQD
jgi:CheY-like chemotaxis protein